MSDKEWDDLVDPARIALEALITSGDNITDRIEELEAKLAKAMDAALDAAASLAAAISLLDKGGKNAAPSNRMFNQMLTDYRNSLERARATIAELEGKTDE